MCWERDVGDDDDVDDCDGDCDNDDDCDGDDDYDESYFSIFVRAPPEALKTYTPDMAPNCVSSSLRWFKHYRFTTCHPSRLV